MAGICRAAAAARSAARRISTSPLTCRSFAAAAAVEYDSEWEEEERRRGAPTAASAAWGEIEGRGVQWVFMGSPGAQKRACATRVAELLEVPYISMGSLVRQELHPRSSLYIKITNAVNEGKLVPEDIIFRLLSKRLEEGYLRGETGFILDGIPRTPIQAGLQHIVENLIQYEGFSCHLLKNPEATYEILDQIADIDLVVNFKCVENCLVKKHFGSDICLHCRKSFDMSNSESTSLNPCLATRTRHSQIKPSAVTDIDETRMEKFRIYSEQNKQLEEYYKKQNKLLDFQVSGGPGETLRGLLAALHLQHMDAGSSSWKLTV